MKRIKRRNVRFALGILLLLLTTGCIVWMAEKLGKTSRQSIDLADTANENWDWEYEVLTDAGVQKVRPEYLNGFPVFSQENIKAIRMTRVMEEIADPGELEFLLFGEGIEVFLDDTILYSDFYTEKRDENGLVEKEGNGDYWSQEFRKVRFSLPEGYMGKMLKVVTYYPDEAGGMVSPAYPSLNVSAAEEASAAVSMVLPGMVVTVSAIIVLLLAVILLLRMKEGGTDWSLAALMLFYLVIFCNQISGSNLGWYSEMGSSKVLQIFNCICPATLLCIYLACRMTGWRKAVLSGGTFIQMIYYGTVAFIHREYPEYMMTEHHGRDSFILFLLLLVVTFFEYIHKKRAGELKNRNKLVYGLLALTAGFVSVFYIGVVINGWELSQLARNLPQAVFIPVRYGLCRQINMMLSIFAALFITVIAVVEFIQQVVENHQMVSILEEKNRMMLASCEMVQEAADETRSARHELRHHAAVLADMLGKGDTDSAAEYVSSLSESADRLSATRYSQNTLVNTIAGIYLGRAKKQGITAEYSLQVPEYLEIENLDLSVLLCNMLENAVEACERMDGGERYIRVQMQRQGNVFLVDCVNSMVWGTGTGKRGKYPTVKKDKKNHGYGIAAMQKVAEKYGGILETESSKEQFRVSASLICGKSK